MQSPLHNVGGWLARRAERMPGRPALVDEERHLDDQALEARSARAAGLLAGHGVARGDRVALLLANRSAYLELVFAVARLGAIAIPINTRLAPPEVSHILRDSSPALLVHEPRLAQLAHAACRPLQGAPACLDVDAYEAALARTEPHAAVAPVDADDPMLLMYTSGTTGAPKGALLPHRKTLYNTLNAQLFFDLGSRDNVLVVVPLFHSFGLNILSIPALYTGGCVVLQQGFDPARALGAVAEHSVSYFGGVPTMFRQLLDTLERTPPERFDLRSLRFLFTSGAAIPVEVILGYEARGILLKQGFGQTETSTLCCLEAADAVRKAGSVGRPVFHADVRVVRRETLSRPPLAWETVDPGETGEIVVRGPITMLGYWNNPEATAETIRDGWLRTGDLATVDEEGFITLTGRERDMYISGGENVYPAQVEAAYEAHPDIAEIAVVGVPDPRWGEAGRAYVVLREGAPFDSEALRLWGRERLARFKIPEQFVVQDALPRTVTGKVQKFALER